MRDISGSAAFSDRDPLSAEQDDETDDQKETRRQLRAAWEAMLVQELGGDPFPDIGSEPLGEAGVAGPAKEVGGSSIAAGTTFQQSIQQTMEKLKKSESNLQVRFFWPTLGPLPPKVNFFIDPPSIPIVFALKMSAGRHFPDAAAE